MSSAPAPAKAPAKPEEAKKKNVSLKAVWPEVSALVKPRRGKLALGLLLVLVRSITGLVLPLSPMVLIDRIITPRKPELLPLLVLALLAATAIQAVTSYVLTQLLSKEGQRAIAELRAKVQAHIGRLPVTFYDANKTGTLVSRIMSDVEGVRNLVGTGFVEFIGGLVTAAVSLVFLLEINATMTLVTAAVLIGFTVVLGRAFNVMRPVFRERGKIQADVQGRLTESLGAVRTVKGYHAEERERGVFAEGVQRLLDNVLRTLSAQSVMQLSMALLMGLVGAAVSWYGANHILTNEMTLGQYMAYNMLLGFLIAPIFQIVNIGTQLTEALAGLERTRDVLAEAREDADPKRTHALGVIRGDVAFEHVDFAYETDKPVLDDVSFVSPAGTVTALVGSSGSGKSTIIGLVSAFHSPGTGRVTVDGVDLSTVRLDTFRTQLGVVLQDSFLFAGTIRENVAFSRPGATDDDVREACRIARVDEFADRFPEGLDTIVGERGVKLSGGQRQRVSIARALLADPRILILDEATSSLDSESEAIIQAGLSHLMKGRTTFVIAHRLSTIRRADQILVVEEGRIVERGDHAALYAASGRYRDLYDRQHGLEQNLFLAPGEGDDVPEDDGPRGGRGAREPGMLDAMQGGAR
ncbi:MAG: ABC transporter ATP-binding protein [Candidatus Eisenbacteria bacterium]|nr:ABC transporter ATP-binding protein [Candidatus Eisenbacteria bacterium]